MDCFIRIKDGVPFEHPIHPDNFKDAFPEIDPNNLPEGFAYFKRLEKPFNPNPFKLHNCEYVKIDDKTWGDKWTERNATPEEEVSIKLDLDKQLRELKVIYKDVALRTSSSTTNNDIKTYCSNYINTLENYQITNYLSINVPQPPLLDASNRLFIAGN
jgi:alkylhydroperoxidase/carboxymuconolactone decarboxylase family protein YurZ